LYRTGDFGRIVNGRVYYEGRQDMQVRRNKGQVSLSLQIFLKFKVSILNMNEPIKFFVYFSYRLRFEGRG
jgi:hypothetical protein